jgi:hypothetical protein
VGEVSRRWTKAPRSRRVRARLAVAACVLWVAGFEVLPWLHVALHDELAPHVHVGDTIVTVSFDGPTHRHADGTVHRDDDSLVGAAPKKLRADGRAHASAPSPLSHGDHSLAHHGVAAIPAAAPLHEPLPIDRRPISVAAVDGADLISLSVPVAAARGPPAFASC